MIMNSSISRYREIMLHPYLLHMQMNAHLISGTLEQVSNATIAQRSRRKKTLCLEVFICKKKIIIIITLKVHNSSMAPMWICRRIRCIAYLQ